MKMGNFNPFRATKTYEGLFIAVGRLLALSKTPAVDFFFGCDYGVLAIFEQRLSEAGNC